MRRLAPLVLAATLMSACAASYPGRISEIEGTDALNQLSADSAPQQSVVNGWTARDYLKLVAEQNTEQSFLMYGLVVLLALLLLRSVRTARASQSSEIPADHAGAPVEPGTP